MASRLSIIAIGAFVVLLSACAKIEGSLQNLGSTDNSSIAACANDSVTTGPCVVKNSGVVVSDDFGNDVTSWSNPTSSTTVEAPIPNGFYANQDVKFTDADLNAANIASGVSIFGVTGTAPLAAAACTDNSLNASACTTAANRYVTATAGSNVTTWLNTLSTTTVSAAIADGFYQGKSCELTDANLVSANIKSGTTLFGVLGTLTPAYSACTDDALNAGQCSTAANRYVTATAGANVSGANGSLSATIPLGFQDGTRTCSMSDTNLTAGNIRSGATVFGVAGSYTGTFSLNMASTAMRDAGVAVVPYLTTQTTSSQLNLASEASTYAGQPLPTTSGYNYRDIPDVTKDDEGNTGITCKYVPRPSVNCGTSQATLALRIADCATANPTASSWDGTTQCSRGQGAWKLVARQAANKEVWQDQRTGLLWSSVVNTSKNWCQASGNAQLAPVTFTSAYNATVGTPITGNGTIGSISGGPSSLAETITITFSSATAFSVSSSGGASGCQGGAITAGGLTGTANSTVTWSMANVCSFTITQGSTTFANNDKIVLASIAASTTSCAPGAASGLQPASPISYCAEDAGLNPGTGDDWTTPAYMAAKGGLGKNSTPSVRWRLPSAEDYKIADVNGLRMVLPDGGAAGTNRPVSDSSAGAPSWEWTAGVPSLNRNSAWLYSATNGNQTSNPRAAGNNFAVRCVGR